MPKKKPKALSWKPIPLIASFEIGEPPPPPEYLCGPFDNIILRAFKEGTTWDVIEPRLRALYEEAIRLQHPLPAPQRGRPSKLVPPESGIEFYFRLIDEGLAQGEAEGEITRTPGQAPMGFRSRRRGSKVRCGSFS